jgi:glycosyltransferase involved in cell wall biosynthesis
MGRLRVVYSFPGRLGRVGIGTTAWYQVQGLIDHGVEVDLYCGSCERPISGARVVRETMSLFGIPMSYRVLGKRAAFWWHDYRVRKAIERDASRIDIIHSWPSGSLQTFSVARRLGIATALERPSSHTAQVYEVLAEECEQLHLSIDADHYSKFDETRLAQEKAEFGMATCLLCPSDAAAATHVERGCSPESIKRHQYGYDPRVFALKSGASAETSRVRFLFVGECFPLKGLHIALRAWLASGVAERSEFHICGRFMPQYERALSDYLRHPNVVQLGFVANVAEVMSKCDVLVHPSLSEGSALVTYEARAMGLVLLVSAAAGAPCTHMHDGLVHPTGDAVALAEHIREVVEDVDLRGRLRRQSVAGTTSITWAAAAERLATVYGEVIEEGRRGVRGGCMPEAGG